MAFEHLNRVYTSRLNASGKKPPTLAVLWTIFYISAMFLPRLIPEGTFLDGVTYAAISRNMAIGLGSFWEPYFSSSFWLPYHNGSVFYEHPPLMFGIQSLFFRLFGAHYAVEKIYCLLNLLLTIGLMWGLWRLLARDHQDLRARDAWLPILFWYTMPVVFWAYPNNLLDSTMAVWCLLAVMSAYQGMRAGGQATYWLIASGISVFLAFLTKGPVGLFPLATPAIYILVYRPKLRLQTFLQVLIPTFVSGLCMLVLLQNTAAHAFMTNYFEQQVMGSLAAAREANPSLWGRAYLVRSLLIELLPSLIISGAFLGVAYRKRKSWKSLFLAQKPSLFCLLVGLSASLPMLLSVKQSTFYLVPALPYFAFSLACMSLGSIRLVALGSGLTPRKVKWIRWTLWSAIVMVLLYSASLLGQIGRPKDKNLIQEMAVFSADMPPGTRIAVCQGLMENGALHAYLMRYYRLELCLYPCDTPYLMNEKRCGSEIAAEIAKTAAQLINEAEHQYRVYQRKQYEP